MAWERRKRGGLYYTRSKKSQGRVVREYVGTGEVAQAIAAMDSIAQLERKRNTEALQVERERFDELDRVLGELCEVADLVVASAMAVAGYHRHNRGEWRRKRRENDRE
jgi:hypothetical protein